MKLSQPGTAKEEHMSIWNNAPKNSLAVFAHLKNLARCMRTESYGRTESDNFVIRPLAHLAAAVEDLKDQSDEAKPNAALLGFDFDTERARDESMDVRRDGWIGGDG